MAEIVQLLIFLQDQMRLYHWQTTSHSRHMASGDLYGSLSDHTDTFVEVYQGIHGRIKLTTATKVIKLDNVDDKKIVSILKTCKEKLIKMTSKITDTDLLNIRDEILASMNKTFFLFTLK